MIIYYVCVCVCVYVKTKCTSALIDKSTTVLTVLFALDVHLDVVKEFIAVGREVNVFTFHKRL